MKNDPVSLLHDMMMTQAFHAAIPFQCISLLSVPAKERSLPSVEQIKEDMLAGRGGVSEHIHETVSRSTGLYNILEPRQSLLTTTL